MVLELQAKSLLSSSAVRERCDIIYALGLQDKLAHFKLQCGRLPEVADYVAQIIQQNYPDLRVPPHARWRHFMVAGADRYQAARSAGLFPSDPRELARVRCEIAITSVLLDAGSGPRWSWRQIVARPDGSSATIVVARSEGLALASLNAYTLGLFSSDQTGYPCRADQAALARLTEDDLARAFQVGPENPLDGLAGRVALLNRLGRQIVSRPDIFGADGRLGGLLDTLVRRAAGGHIEAPDVLSVVLDALGPIWPGRLTLDGVPLGDTWRHGAINVPGPTRGLIPFHKLSQWLTYSLIEPLEEAGLTVTGLDDLTGLAEYRNGGLLLDMGVIVPRDDQLTMRKLMPADEPIVEWRALTVSLLDALAPLVRQRLGKTQAQMSLASILEGGTWAAGRRIARQIRPDGGPPLSIESDGSVF